MIDVDTFGSAKVDESTIIERVKKAFSFKPADMERVLGLRKPIFRQTTNYGHFTKADLPWEKLDEQSLPSCAASSRKCQCGKFSRRIRSFSGYAFL